MERTVHPSILRLLFFTSKPIASIVNVNEDGMTNPLIQSLVGFLLVALCIWLIFGED
jgi:hypothetical protein